VGEHDGGPHGPAHLDAPAADEVDRPRDAARDVGDHRPHAQGLLAHGGMILQWLLDSQATPSGAEIVAALSALAPALAAR
jgi:hypothetical protein